MLKDFLFLQNVHTFVHDLPMKSKYSIPKHYTGGVDISTWNKLTSKQKSEALLKDWYVYFSYRNPKTGKLERQPNIKAGVNKFKSKDDRIKYLDFINERLLFLLKQGFNPFENNKQLENKLKNKSDNTEKIIVSEKKVEKEDNSSELTIKEAFEFGLKIKKNVVGDVSYNGLKGRVNRFLKWISVDSEKPVSALTRKVINNYLNHVLENTSARSRNNTRIDLSSLVQTLVDNEIMKENFIKSINVLKSSPERNKTYSSTQETDILKYLEETDPILLLFIQFITYNFLRPVEVCRLRIGDLDIEGKKLFVKAKNKEVKVKIIPQKIIDLLPDLSTKDTKHYLFTPTIIGGEWEAEENNRRNYYSKRFKLVKDHFGLDEKYGLYSFRHTSITNLYKELNKTLTPFETKSTLMQITGHQTMEALEKYLRDIDAALPEDYSHLLK